MLRLLIHHIRKFFLLYIGIITVLTITGGSILIMRLQKDPAMSDGVRLGLAQTMLNKTVEKLPIPKITLIPITPTMKEEVAIQGVIIDDDVAYLQNQILLEPTAIPTLPTRWNKYINNKLKFSITYPADLAVQEKSHGFGVWDISLYANREINKLDFRILGYPKTIGKLIGVDFDTVYNLPANSLQIMKSREAKDQLLTKLNNKIFDGLRGFEFEIRPDPPDPYEDIEIGVSIEIEENILIISTGENNRAILNAMLASFRSDY